MVVSLLGSQMAVAQQDDSCDINSVMNNHFGPFDYFDQANHEATKVRSEGNVGIVVKNHFTRPMLRLERGHNDFKIKKDLEYTLSALPNYPEALDLASRFEKKRADSEEFRLVQPALEFSAECYFKRAEFFSPQYAYTHLIWGIHLHRNGQYSEAVKQYGIAEKKGLKSAELYYNRGLTYVELKELKLAQADSNQAYDMGFPLSGLKNKILSLEKELNKGK